MPIAYSQIEDVYIVSRWDDSQKFCIRIVISDGSVLLQLSNKWLRDQWLHSINWKRNMLKFQRILVNSSIRSDVLIKELKNLIDLSLTTPLQDESIHQTPLEIISELLNNRLISVCLVTTCTVLKRLIVAYNQFNRSEQTPEVRANAKALNEEIIAIISPLLERTNPTQEICQFLSQVSTRAIMESCNHAIARFDCCFCLSPLVLRPTTDSIDLSRYQLAIILAVIPMNSLTHHYFFHFVFHEHSSDRKHLSDTNVD